MAWGFSNTHPPLGRAGVGGSGGIHFSESIWSPEIVSASSIPSIHRPENQTCGRLHQWATPQESNQKAFHLGCTEMIAQKHKAKKAPNPDVLCGTKFLQRMALLMIQGRPTSSHPLRLRPPVHLAFRALNSLPLSRQPTALLLTCFRRLFALWGEGRVRGEGEGIDCCWNSAIVQPQCSAINGSHQG